MKSANAAKKRMSWWPMEEFNEYEEMNVSLSDIPPARILGKNHRIPLPSCAIKKIQFPSDIYTSFKCPALD
ncbi:hypothetical protein F7725_025859 [Dissostichus mawsoni]|uniref:Uncharacterized protein n=1 Tax=Dissostichus mawsoni TaxID=36200 RepID=A0A7J5X5F1_DISMA|nr:hypothetical protein F7725_025859 [Dissostichus mawsoni]